jgi:hypothetical protein
MGSFLSVFNWAKRYYDTVRGKIKKEILEFIVIEKSDRMLTKFNGSWKRFATIS